jgi:hypothetical protein
MAHREFDELQAGLEAATADEPFMMSQAEFVTHVSAHDRTGCGGYSTVETYEGKRVVVIDYACKD